MVPKLKQKSFWGVSLDGIINRLQLNALFLKDFLSVPLVSIGAAKLNPKWKFLAVALSKTKYLSVKCA